MKGIRQVEGIFREFLIDVDALDGTPTDFNRQVLREYMEHEASGDPLEDIKEQARAVWNKQSPRSSEMIARLEKLLRDPSVLWNESQQKQSFSERLGGVLPQLLVDTRDLIKFQFTKKTQPHCVRTGFGKLM